MHKVQTRLHVKKKLSLIIRPVTCLKPNLNYWVRHYACTKNIIVFLAVNAFREPHLLKTQAPHNFLLVPLKQQSTLHGNSPLPILPPKTNPLSSLPPPRSTSPLPIKAYKVTIEHDNRVTYLEVEPDETILSKALDSGLSVPHDCKLGVCMTCPAKLISGVVDQSEGMLSDDVIERGFALLCTSYPRSDCTIRTIPEEKLLSLQLATAND